MSHDSSTDNSTDGQKPTRRIFMLQVAAGSTALIASRVALAQAKVEETDPQAKALDYKNDSTKVDTKKYTKHTPADHCGNCALYQGKAGDASGPCPLFGGKLVAAAGWCSAWSKKA